MLSTIHALHPARLSTLWKPGFSARDRIRTTTASNAAYRTTEIIVPTGMTINACRTRAFKVVSLRTA